jgi:hypothetical protein
MQEPVYRRLKDLLQNVDSIELQIFDIYEKIFKTGKFAGKKYLLLVTNVGYIIVGEGTVIYKDIHRYDFNQGKVIIEKRTSRDGFIYFSMIITGVNFQLG